MAGFNKPKAPNGVNPNEDSVLLKQEYNEVHKQIKEIVGDKKDKSSLTEDEKRELATLYSKLADLSKKLGDTINDATESEKYLSYVDKLRAKAESYGSTRKNNIPPTTFDDVKGLDNVKTLVHSFLYMAEHPDVMKHYNMKGGLGVLLYGAPGTGKTMIAEAIANKLQWPLFMITPSDIFKSYVGASEAAVKQLFKELEACPDGAILFVDECESIFSKRTSETKDYKSAVTNELLQRINGFGVDGSKRILIGATNRPDQIDPAYLRYKRFSYQIHITPPDDVAKRAIIESKLNVGGVNKERDEIKLEAGFGVEDILAKTNRGNYTETDLGLINTVDAYYSAADLTGIIEEACRIAIEKMRDKEAKEPLDLTREMFEEAFSKTPPSISSKLLDAYEKFKEDPTLLDKYYGNR